MSRCHYPGCDRDSEFSCHLCKKQFCAFHIYDSKGWYICKTDYDGMGFDPFAGDSPWQYSKYPWLSPGYHADWISKLLKRRK